MITKYSTSPELYDILFEKATKRLKSKYDGKSGYGDNFHIQTLEEYFSHLRNIIYGQSPVPDEEDYVFLKLPLDEPHFIIDANTRVITVPPEFLRHGIGVVGDEIAEILFFEVDRFYDSVDLFQQDIVIQWQRLENNLYTYQSPAFMKFLSVDSITGDEKIIFGWPITSEMTKEAGKIQFSVRFYTQTGDTSSGNIFDTSSNATTQFSLLTLMAEVFINPGISIAQGYGRVDNSTNIILSRLPQYKGGDTDALPSAPYYILMASGDLKGKVLQVNTTAEKVEGKDWEYIVTEDVEKTGLTLAVLGDKGGPGVLKYNWGYSKDGEDVTEFSTYRAAIDREAYVKVKEYIVGNGSYYHKSSTTSSFFYKTYSTKEEFDEGVAAYGDAYVHCYYITMGGEEDNFLKANGPGTYYALIQNILYDNVAVPADTVQNPAWTFVGPVQPTITAVECNNTVAENVGVVDGQYPHYRIMNNGDLRAVGANVDENTSWTWTHGTNPNTLTTTISTTNNCFFDIAEFEEGYYEVSAENIKNYGHAFSTDNGRYIIFISGAIDDLKESVEFNGNKAIATIGREQGPYEALTYQWYYGSTPTVGIPVPANESGTNQSKDLTTGLIYSCEITCTKGALSKTVALTNIYI